MTFSSKSGWTSFLFRRLAIGVVVASVASSAAYLHAEDLNSVLGKLDAASAKFKSAQADITWDNVQVAPLPDTDTQAGTVLFERSGGQLEMALHLKSDNGKPVEKDLVYSSGLLKLYEPRLKQLQVFKAGNNRSQLDTFLTLGFGGSGKDLDKNWTVTYVGTESVDGVSAAKLQLVPRDASVANTVAKAFLWINSENGSAVRQQFFDPSGNYRMVSYRNVRQNAPVSSGAFEIKTAPGTNIVNR